MNYIISVKATEWDNNESIYVKGHLFFDDKFYAKEALIRLVQTIRDDQLEDFLKRCDGFFSIIIKKESSITLITDHVRLFPVFYNVEKRVIVDNINNDIIKEANLNYPDIAVLKSGFFCLGDSTILTGWKSVMPGSILTITFNSVHSTRYFEYKYNAKRIVDVSQGLEIIKKATNKMIEQAICFLSGRTVVIPLSGGHDSRLLVYLLWKNNYKNIITYSYGLKGNQESLVAREISEKLNIDHYFIEYRNKANSELFDNDFPNLCEYQCNASSIPQIQDWYAVWYLVTNGLVPQDAVFMPGHTGDVLAGDYFEDIHLLPEPVNKEDLINTIIRRHYSFDSSLSFTEKKETIMTKCQYLRECDETIPKDQAEEIFERFNWEERQSKYILNSMKTYGYLGHEYFCPINYRVMFDAWCSIDNSLRYRRQLFCNYDSNLYQNSIIADTPFVRMHARRINPLIKKLSMLLKGPNYSHYMFTYFRISRIKYMRLLLTHRFYDVNYFMQKNYLKAIALIRGMNENL